MGDFNANIGGDGNSKIPKILAHFGLGQKNSRGDLLIKYSIKENVLNELLL